jgi:hypothetical protein
MHYDRYAAAFFFEHTVIARLCLMHGGQRFNAKEREFLTDIQGFHKVSDKQWAWFGGLAKKAKVDWKPPDIPDTPDKEAARQVGTKASRRGS